MFFSCQLRVLYHGVNIGDLLAKEVHTIKSHCKIDYAARISRVKEIKGKHCTQALDIKPYISINSSHKSMFSIYSKKFCCCKSANIVNRDVFAIETVSNQWIKIIKLIDSKGSSLTKPSIIEENRRRFLFLYFTEQRGCLPWSNQHNCHPSCHNYRLELSPLFIFLDMISD